MILPLLMEQFLLMLVGLADTMVVSYAGEAAVSGVSLVNSFNTIFINLFTALASGGAVVVSQYIGRRDMKMASESSSQLLMVATVFAVVISIPVLIWKVPLLKGLFGKVEPDVMEACKHISGSPYILFRLWEYTMQEPHSTEALERQV